MDQFTAVGIAEGWIDSESEEETIEAWQFLIDTKVAFRLQGWFARVAMEMIRDGICHA